MMTEQVECYRCQVWLDDFQTKVIDGDDYCCECAFAVLDIENERLQATNAALLEALQDMLDMHYRLLEELPDAEVGFGFATMLLNARNKATEAIRKASQ